MNFIEIRFSPEAKHFWRWLHTWLAFAAAAAPYLYDNMKIIQGWMSASSIHNLQAGIIVLMVYNTMREKKK